jgi:DNA replication and repair protein RecF
VLHRAKIENFRCVKAGELEFDPQGTGIVGPNGSGKTSLLEALFFLANGRSFRTAVRDTLVGPAENFFRLFGEVAQPLGRSVRVGIEYSAGDSRIRVDGQDAPSVSVISTVLPVQVIDPGVHRLIEEGSARRRRQMDWGVFHVEHEFLATWRRYNRALQQRNAALRQGHDWSAISAWDHELATAGESVDELRSRYMSAFAVHFRQTGEALLEGEVVAEYRRGWNRDFTLLAALESSRVRDRRLRTTTVGPHRADISFKWGSGPARDRVSRGQQKMLAAAFILAQTRFRASQTNSRTTLLLDDPAAELDVDNLGKLLSVVASTPAQLIVTSLSSAGLHGVEIGRMFHVKQGDFRSVL